ncbi:glycosyltransferase family 2 protein [Patescibacteria group bacterium AH-259-L07]|nr:glycosyltransferase family 2 protein [Patescibacteria group bacterium AH-259-L07]
MKLILQIPCFNEEKTLPHVLDGLPTEIDGISEIEVVVIDDGSNDNTAQVAKDYGATVLRQPKNLGLGPAFKRGTEYALKTNADILVNTDGDNQYPGKYIPDVIKPILDNRADMVVGNRRPTRIAHSSIVKKLFQYCGNRAVSRIVRYKIPDAVSGFRAYSRSALYQLHITTKFSYVLDSLIQLSEKNLRIVFCPDNR